MDTPIFSDYMIQRALVKELLREILPTKVVDRIKNVSEEYMIDRRQTGLKVQFENGYWSPALLMDDYDASIQTEASLLKRAQNLDEFVAHCLMMY